LYKYEHLLLDGRNAVYRAVYAALSDDQFMKSGYDCCVVFFRFVSYYLNQYKSKRVHIFWDAPKEDLWRRKIYEDYKGGRDTSRGGKYIEYNVDALVSRCISITTEILNQSNCANYYRDKQEADDLIYAFCRLNVGSKMLIVSSDGDFKQIPFMMRNIDIYNPLNKNDGLAEINLDVNPVDIKCFSGERSDNIIGYPQIGPKRARILVTDHSRRKKFFAEYGRKTYLFNRILIDLTMCPYLFANLSYVERKMSSELKYDEKAIRDIIQKYKVRGLLGEINRVILPFKFLGAG